MEAEIRSLRCPSMIREVRSYVTLAANDNPTKNKKKKGKQRFLVCDMAIAAAKAAVLILSSKRLLLFISSSS